MDWDDLRLFAAVARAGGLAKAQRETGKSAPTLGRRMLALERALCAELFHRHPSGYVLTDEGRALLMRVEALGASVERIVEATGRSGPAVIKVSAGTWTTKVLCERSASLFEGTQTSLRFIAADHSLDIAHREAVVGIRNARPDGPGLAGRRVGRVSFAAYAHKGEAKPWIRVSGTTPSARWLDRKTEGCPAIEVTNPRSALDLALVGAGQALLPTFIGDGQSGLVRVSEPIAELDHDQWLVTHHDDRHEPDVRLVIERIARVLIETHRTSK